SSRKSKHCSMTMRPPQRGQLVALASCLHPLGFSSIRYLIGNPTAVAIDGLPSSTVRRSNPDPVSSLQKNAFVKPFNTHARVATAAGRSAPCHRPSQPPPMLCSRLRDSVWPVHGPLPVVADTSPPRPQGDSPHRAGPWPVGDR